MLKQKEWGIDWGPGYRYFKCDSVDDGCGYEYKDRTRDCTSPSSDSCPMCGAQTSPHDYEMHLEWAVDDSKNLMSDE